MCNQVKSCTNIAEPSLKENRPLPSMTAIDISRTSANHHVQEVSPARSVSGGVGPDFLRVGTRSTKLSKAKQTTYRPKTLSSLGAATTLQDIRCWTSLSCLCYPDNLSWHIPFSLDKISLKDHEAHKPWTHNVILSRFFVEATPFESSPGV